MLRELSAGPAPLPHSLRASSGQLSAEPVSAARGAVPASAAPELPEPVRAVEQAIQLAASALFHDRPVEVQGFRDEASGRFVYRVTDRRSGEVLTQSPPEALLRFFASARAALGPLVEIEA